MKKFANKIITFMLVLAIISSVGVLPTFAAGNYTDSSFSLTCPTYGYLVCEGNVYRKKLDSTATYVHCISGPSTGVYFTVWGGIEISTNYSVPVANCTRYGQALIYPGQQRFIAQYVYENDYEYAHLGLLTRYATDVGTTVTGVWSPDSVGSYPYAN